MTPRTDRVKVLIPARIEGVPADYTVLDLARGGMFLAGPPSFTIGDVLHIDLEAPQDGFLVAQVRWVRPAAHGPLYPAGIGVQFVGDRTPPCVNAYFQDASAASAPAR